MAEMQQPQPAQEAPQVDAAPQAQGIEEVNTDEVGGVRNFRPRRYVYSEEDRDRAIKMLENGVPCRQVAQSLGPRCSSGTPIRWRKLKQKQEQSRLLMEQMLTRPGNEVANRR